MPGQVPGLVTRQVSRQLLWVSRLLRNRPGYGTGAGVIIVPCTAAQTAGGFRPAAYG